jgi:PKD repeat protein
LQYTSTPSLYIDSDATPAVATNYVPNTSLPVSIASGGAAATVDVDYIAVRKIPSAGDPTISAGVTTNYFAIAPTASFTASPTSGSVPLQVTFTDTSTANPTSWAWNFGDGTTSNVQSPTHTYNTIGTYTVTLTASNAYGSDSETTSITVNAVAPVASFSGTPLSGSAPLQVQFTDSSNNNPTSWSWNFGDGQTSTQQNPIHQYSLAGTYTVALTATNSAGSDTSTRSNYVTVSSTGSAPVASFTANVTSGTTPLLVLFTDASTGSPTSWYWDFGDSYTSTDQNPSHTYTQTGVYTVKLTVQNASGNNTLIRTAYITSTQGTSQIVPIRVAPLMHPAGSTRVHPFVIIASDGSLVSECTNPVIVSTVNCIDQTEESWEIGTFNNTMMFFPMTVIADDAWVDSDNINISITCDEGQGFLPLTIVGSTDISASLTAYGVPTTTDINNAVAPLSTLDTGDITSAISTLATANALTAAQTDLTSIKSSVTPITLAAIRTQADNALSNYDAPTKAELDAAFTEIKGSGWATQTLVALKSGQFSQDQLISFVTSALGSYTVPTFAQLTAAFTEIKGSGWTNETLATIRAALLTAAQVWAYTGTRALSTTPATPADVTSITSTLARTTDLATVGNNVLGIKSVTDQLSLSNIKLQVANSLNELNIPSIVWGWNNRTLTEMGSGGTGFSIEEFWTWPDRTLTTSPATAEDINSILQTYGPAKPSDVSVAIVNAALAKASDLKTANDNITLIYEVARYLSLANIKNQVSLALVDAAIPSAVWLNPTRTLTSTGASGAVTYEEVVQIIADADLATPTDVSAAITRADLVTNTDLEAAIADINVDAGGLLAAINNDLIDGTLTRKEKERIELALFIGDSTRSSGTETFKAQDGTTDRLIVTDSNTSRRTITKNGD